MSAFAWDAQQAIYSALTGNSPVICDVYDAVPQGATFPYIEIGEGQSIPDDVSDDGGASDLGISDFYDLHIWSRYAGQKETRQIVDAIHALLHEQSLTISGRASALSWVRSVRYLVNPDGLTRHGIVTVEVIHRS